MRQRVGLRLQLRTEFRNEQFAYGRSPLREVDAANNRKVPRSSRAVAREYAFGTEIGCLAQQS
jgi:hypothetical protein